jgi:hypothetical protein
MTALNSATAALLPYVSGPSASAFSIGFVNAPAASQSVGTYQVSYHVLGS